MKAIFHRDIEVRAHKRNIAWSVKASPYPQSFPRECIEIAVERGAATVEPPRRTYAKATETADE